MLYGFFFSRDSAREFAPSRVSELSKKLRKLCGTPDVVFNGAAARISAHVSVCRELIPIYGFEEKRFY